MLKMLKSATALGLLGSMLVTGNANADDHNHASDHVWRLFIADHTKPVIRAIDLKSGKELNKFDVKGYAGLTASASGETVFAVQSDADMVNIIKTGIKLSDHGDHRDLEVSDTAMLPLEIAGQRPVHAVMHGDTATLFFDREGKAKLYSEQAIIAGKAKPETIDATAPHHGVVVPFGDQFLASVPNLEVETKPDDLPPRLGLRVLDADGKQSGDVATCTALHGEALSARIAALGCEEGVLLAIPGKDKTAELKMLAYGADLPKGKVSTLLGSKAMQFFLGNYGEDKIALIDPESDTPYRLVDLPTRRIDFALDPARLKNAYVLTEDGQLHLINILDGTITRSAKVTEPYSKDGHWRDARPRLAVAGDHIAITDPRHSLVRLINIESFKEDRTITVADQPFSIVAVGGSGATH